MIRSRYLWLLGLALASACTSNPVGRICDLGSQLPAPSEVVVASPSLDCVSHTCLRVPLGRVLPEGSVYPDSSGLCTAECENEGDCDRVPESPCKTGFTCGVAVTVGPFCCKKFCICKDYIQIPEATGQLAQPEACDAATPANSCCNLPGRTGNADYPLCKS